MNGMLRLKVAESEFGPYQTSPGLLVGRKVTRAGWASSDKTTVEIELENGRMFHFYSKSPIIFDYKPR